MPATKRQQQTADQKTLIEAALIAWNQCLKEHGLAGAPGCAHLAVDAAKAFVAELRNELRKQP